MLLLNNNEMLLCFTLLIKWTQYYYYTLSLQSWRRWINSIIGMMLSWLYVTLLYRKIICYYYMWHCFIGKLYVICDIAYCMKEKIYVIMIICDIALCMGKLYVTMGRCDIAYWIKEENICHYDFMWHCLCMKEEIICYLTIYNLILELWLVMLCLP